MKQASKEENRKQEVQLSEFAVDQLHIIWDWTTSISIVRAQGWKSLALFLNCLPGILPLHGGSNLLEINKIHKKYLKQFYFAKSHF